MRNGDPLYALFVRGDRLDLGIPGAHTVGASEHFLEGGHTAINIGGGYMVNATRELIATGGMPVAAGDFVARFEQLSEASQWIWRVVRVF